MTDVALTKVVSLAVTQFPQNLLIPEEKNTVSLQITNNSNKEESFILEFKGENLDVNSLSMNLEGEVKFKVGETKNIDLNLIPKTDGYGKLILNVYWFEYVKYKVKVQRIREKASGNNIKKILKSKNFLSTESIKPFNSRQYFLETSRNDVKQMERNLKSFKQEKEMNKRPEGQISASFNDIDTQLKQIAKAYLFLDDFYKALETSLELSSEDEKIQFYYDLLRAYASRNLEACLQVVKNLADLPKKDQIIADISLDLLDINPEEVLKIISLIDNNSIKEATLLNIISKAANNNNFQLILKFSQLIDDSVIRIKVLFNIIKILFENNNKGMILPILNQINQTILNSESSLLSNKNSHNLLYDYLKESIYIIAELDCPISAESLITGIKNEELRKKVTNDLFDVIYEMVDEIQTKIEKKIALSYSYSVNTYASNINREIKKFSHIGGNVSNNILMKNYDFNFILISLFSFNFSIFPIIDRLFLDVNYNTKKSFAYYLFPSISNHDEEELSIIKQTLTQFFSPIKISKQLIIFNLDFIPYLGKPTVILSEEGQLVQNIKSKLEKHMKNELEIIVSNGMFKGGDAQITLNNIFQGRNFTVINLILSYEFLNNYEVFKSFIESII